MNEVLNSCISHAKRQRRSVFLPEGDDPRVQRAARELLDQGIATPVLGGQRENILRVAQQQQIDIQNIGIVDATEASQDQQLADALIGKRKKIRAHNVFEFLQQPVYQGVALLHTGRVEAMVAGAVLATAKVLEASFAVGPKADIKTLSSFFLMSLRDPAESIASTLMFADCALNVEPDAEQLAEIAITSASSARKLLEVTPRVALLSFSTHGSARHTSIGKVNQALKIVRQREPKLDIDGELQVDAALSMRVATSKLEHQGSVAGRANVLIFPDLNAGNIAYKLVQYCGGAQATGPILQGFSKPVCDLSRGCSVEDIIAATAVTLRLGDDS